MPEINVVGYENRQSLCYYDEPLKSCLDLFFQKNLFLHFFQDFQDAQHPVSPQPRVLGLQKLP